MINLDPLATLREAQATLAVAGRSGIEGLGVACYREWKLRRVGHVISNFLELSLLAARGQPGGVKLGVIEVAPRSGKTLRAAVLAPARGLGLDPHLQIVAGCHSRELAGRNVRDCRQIMQVPAYSDSFRTRLRSTVHAPGQLRTHAEDRATMFRTLYQTKGGEVAAGDGYYLSTSLASGLTGWGFHLGICDDLIASDADVTETNLEQVWGWYQSVFWTRQHAERSAIILMGTRWHPADPIGRAIAQWEAAGMAYYRCRLPALLDEDLPADSYDWREPGEWLIDEPKWVEHYERSRLVMEPERWEAMYQQRPMRAGGNLFREADFGRYDPRALLDYDAVVISVDPASKKTGASRCALGVWGIGAGRLDRLDQVVGRWDYADFERAYVNLCIKWPEATVKLIEDTSNGVPLLSRLRSADTAELAWAAQGLVAVKPPANSKETRGNMALPDVRAGRVRLPNTTHGKISSTWVKEYLAEMARFPAAPNDLADETTQVIQWARDSGFFRVVA